MMSIDKEVLHRQKAREVARIRLVNGIRRWIKEGKVKVIFLVVLLVEILMWVGVEIYCTKVMSHMLLGEMISSLYELAFWIVFAIGQVGFFYLAGTPKGAFKIDNLMRRICVHNNVGESPSLIRVEKGKQEKECVYVFFGYGIPPAFYQDHQEEIEAALNINIMEIQHGNDKREMKVTFVPYGKGLPDLIPWSSEYLVKEEGCLSPGISLLGNEIIDLNRTCHVLLGGSTSSGKSNTLKCLVYQAAIKGAQVYVADFKGGVDYTVGWNDFITLVYDNEALLKVLEMLATELEHRKDVLRMEGYKNIVEYNSFHREKMRRIIFACDEVAELLDTTGVDKAGKEQITRIIGYLSTIARQGRAFGIHLILATQRPDANVLPGQIKNNMDYRMCGKADNVLSQIILDSTEASEKIPKSEQGLFVTNNGRLVRGFFFDEGKEWK